MLKALIRMKNITYPQQCEEVQNEKCQDKDVKVPKQMKEHKKKCLLPDDAAMSGDTSTMLNIMPRAPTPPTTTSSFIPSQTSSEKPPKNDDNLVRLDYQP